MCVVYRGHYTSADELVRPRRHRANCCRCSSFPLLSRQSSRGNKRPSSHDRRMSVNKKSESLLVAALDRTRVSALDRFIEASKRRDEYLKTFEPEEEQGDDGDREGDEGGVSRESEATRKKIQEKTGGDSNGPDDARATPVAREEKKEGSRHTGPAPAEEGREGVTPVGKEDGGGSAVGNAAEESRRRQAERDLIEEQLEKEALALFHELRECTTYHDL